MVLEDVEASSLRVFLKNTLSRVDDEALKTLDWKPVVGRYLVKAKYLALEFLDGKVPVGDHSLSYLKEGIVTRRGNRCPTPPGLRSNFMKANSLRP